VRLPAEFIRLPFRVDHARIAAELATVDPTAWRPHPEGHPGNWALPLVATGGDPTDDSVRGPMLPTPHLGTMPYTRQVLAALGAPVGRTRFMRLDGDAEATTHVDINDYWQDRVRVHLPVRTRPAVLFHCGERTAHMAAGEAWIFDTSIRHNVVNPGGEERIHLVVDTAGSTAFSALIAAGEVNPDAPGIAPLLEVGGDAITFEAPVDPLARPIFILSAPRSGSTLLFETLAQSPGIATIGGESHELIEGIAGLHPSAHDWASNRLTAADATPEVVAELRRRLSEAIRDRDGNPVEAGVTLLEKTPKNALRIPFLAAAFPEARFVYLYRDPVDTLASTVEGWRSGRFTTYPELPGWDGLPWSFLLVPGWQDLQGLPLAELAARQWSTTVETIVDDLLALPPDRWSVTAHGQFLQDPQGEIERLCSVLGLPWDRQLPATLPASKTTLTPPAPGKWRSLANQLAPVLPIVAGASDRARGLFAREPGPDRATQALRETSTREPFTPEEVDAGFSSQSTASFAHLLAGLASSVVVTTYQTGRVIIVRQRGEGLNTHLRAFDTPMGVATDGAGRLVIGTRREVWEYRDQPAVARKVEPAGSHDACYLPRRAHVTGDLRIHDVAIAGDGQLWAVNTLFSCLATFDEDHSFVPRWQPWFVSELAPEDRCHLNGLAMVDGAPRYVTALGTTDTAGGWRADKVDGGVVIDIDADEIVARGLAMPHSPRWHDGQLWVLESGKGGLSKVDPATGEVTCIAELPGFTRGLSFAGPYAFVGLSQVRETLFEGIPIKERPDRACGVWVVDTRNGETVAFLRFQGLVQEIFDVQVLAGVRYPDLAEPGDERVASSYVVPDDALAQVPARLRAE
jgi:uncharacterized protein (TIGR03032 family)